jgi:hypothetical protein
MPALHGADTIDPSLCLRLPDACMEAQALKLRGDRTQSHWEVVWRSFCPSAVLLNAVTSPARPRRASTAPARPLDPAPATAAWARLHSTAAMLGHVA